jgi:hypothetical protein
MYVQHAYGTPPSAGGDWTSVTVTTLDKILVSDNDLEKLSSDPAETGGEPGLSIIPSEPSDTLHVAWHRTNSLGETEVRYLWCDVSSTTVVYSDTSLPMAGNPSAPWDRPRPESCGKEKWRSLRV